MNMFSFKMLTHDALYTIGKPRHLASHLMYLQGHLDLGLMGVVAHKRCAKAETCSRLAHFRFEEQAQEQTPP